jgi:hypothetical protein
MRFKRDLAAAAALLTGLAACAGETPQVDGEAELVAEQAASAEKLVDCLDEEKLEVWTGDYGITGYETLFVSVLPVPESESYFHYVPGIGGGASEDYSDQAPWPEEMPPTLIDGGVDKSAALQQCIKESGYFMPAPVFDKREEEVDKVKMADASNEWAACARQNGFPGIKDTGYEVDNWKTRPQALVPGSIEPAQLEALLDVCPYGLADATVQPQVEIDLPQDDDRYRVLRSILVENLRENVPASDGQFK